jgi:hypothetical protein
MKIRFSSDLEIVPSQNEFACIIKSLLLMISAGGSCFPAALHLILGMEHLSIDTRTVSATYQSLP